MQRSLEASHRSLLFPILKKTYETEVNRPEELIFLITEAEILGPHKTVEDMILETDQRAGHKILVQGQT